MGWQGQRVHKQGFMYKPFFLLFNLIYQQFKYLINFKLTFCFTLSGIHVCIHSHLVQLKLVDKMECMIASSTQNEYHAPVSRWRV